MESDEELMAAVAGGDERALGSLVDRHAGRIHAHLVRVTGSADDADDLLQDTWVRVARGVRTYQSGRPVRPWLFGIAANLARDLQRRRTVRSRTAAQLSAEPAAPVAGARPVERIALRAGLARLPERLREVVWLRYYEDLDEAQTAEALGIPRGTVKSRLHDAIRALKRDWEDGA